MKKALSFFILFVGYLSIVYALKDIPLDRVLPTMIGFLLVSLGAYYIISENNLLAISFFKKRPGALLVLFILPIFVAITIIILNKPI